MATKSQPGLIRALTEMLLGKADKAETLRAALARALSPPEARTAFDVFGSDLPDEAFEGVFNQPRQRNWREVDL
jgi:hypothetical protein